MVGLGYVGAIIGCTLGSLGAMTGTFGTLAQRRPEKYRRWFRVMVCLDMVIGGLLTAAAVFLWLRGSTVYERELAGIMFSSGFPMVTILGAIYAYDLRADDKAPKEAKLL